MQITYGTKDKWYIHACEYLGMRLFGTKMLHTRTLGSETVWE